MLIGLVVLLTCWLAGEALVNVLALPLPGNVAGMLILLLGCMLRRKVDTYTQTAGSALLSYMALLFVPAGVGLIEHTQLLVHDGVAIFLVLTFSTAVTMAITALTLHHLLRRRCRGQEE